MSDRRNTRGIVSEYKNGLAKALKDKRKIGKHLIVKTLFTNPIPHHFDGVNAISKP